MSVLHDAGGALAGLLDSIDDAKLCQVIRLVEASGQRRTLEPAIADLRPRLRRLRPPRPLSLSRLIALPLAPVLAAGDDTPSAYTITRPRLGFWLARLTERIDPMVALTTRAAITGHAVDDEAAVIEAGRCVWPAAAGLLAADVLEGEHAVIDAERRRIADLFDIAEQLLPQLGRLPSVLKTPLDDDHRAAVGGVLALAEGGPPDRLGMLATLLLRRGCLSMQLVDRLIDLAPPTARSKLTDLLPRLLAEYRADLARQLAPANTDDAPSLEAAIDRLARLADDPLGPSRPRPAEPRSGSATERSPSNELRELRQTAAAIAQARYAAGIEHLCTSLLAADAADRAATIAAQEQTARQLARLGSLVRRLSPATAVHELTGAAIERLVDLQARRRGGSRSIVSVEQVRLIEILAGPRLARHYLGLEADGETAGCRVR